MALDPLLLDAAELEAFRHGDVIIFARVFDYYKGEVAKRCFYRLKNFHDAEDLTLIIFAKFALKTAQVTSSEHLANLLYKITHDELVNAMKKKSRHPLRFIGSTSEMEPVIPGSTVDPLEEKIYLEALNQILLSETKTQAGKEEGHEKRYWEVFRMHQQGIERQEIANRLKISISTVHNQIAYAQKKIANALRKYGITIIKGILWYFLLFF